MSTTEPYLIGETILTPADRASIMTGRRYSPERGDEDSTFRVRFIVTARTASGCPIVTAERENGRDALGSPRWEAYDPPARLLVSALARVFRDAQTATPGEVF